MTPAEVEIQVKKGGTGLHKAITKINLVYKGLKEGGGLFLRVVIFLSKICPLHMQLV